MKLVKLFYKLFAFILPPIKIRKKYFKPSNEELDKKADEVLQELARRNKRGK